MYFVMKKIDLKKVNHDCKVGGVCPPQDPNVVEDSLFILDGEPIGFYIKSIEKYSKKCSMLASVANAELRSKRVPKSTMKRSSGFIAGDSEQEVLQYSTIIGSIPPKPHMRRPYPTMSSVHSVKSAETFVKAMLGLCRESEEIIKQLTPNIYEYQTKVIEDGVPKQWRFGRMFTSSISNYNIAASYHQDNANIKGLVNVIITKKHRAKGGNTCVPDYGAVVDSCDDSMLVYPAWANLHGVTPIEPTMQGGYRNSLVFYPLKAFLFDNLTKKTG